MELKRMSPVSQFPLFLIFFLNPSPPLHDILTGTGAPRLSIAGTDSQSKSTIVNIASPLTTRQTDDWFAEEENVDRRYG